MVAELPRSPARHIFDVRIDALDMDGVLGAVDRSVQSRQRLLIGAVNAAKMVKMNSDQTLRRAVLGADLIVPDGMSVVWAGRFLRQRLPSRVTGIDLFYGMLALADRKGYRVYLLGAADDVLERVRTYVQEHYPNAKIVGSRNGYFEQHEEESVARAVAEARPDMLFVAITSPKKENFLARWNSLMNVPVCHGVGGSFDVMAGKVKRAPAFWQRLGLEWLYRVCQEPGRLWRRYLVTNSLFVAMLAREAFRSLRRLFVHSGPTQWKGV